MYLCFKRANVSTIFALLYILLSAYFTSIMVRLVLVLTPVVCMLGGIGANYLIDTFTNILTWSNYSEYKLKIGDYQKENQE